MCVRGRPGAARAAVRQVSERDETRPIQCTACGRSFTQPRWIGLRGPLCAACFDRLQREDQVRLLHTRKPDGLRGWLRALLGR